MGHEITIDKSLMCIQQHHIDAFNSTADKMYEFNYILKESAFAREKDKWNIVFTIWLLLLPDKHGIIESVEKTLHYSSVFVVLNALKSNSYFQSLRKRSNGTKELNYLASLIIANGIDTWVLKVMEKYNITDIMERNKKHIFFEVHNQPKEEVQIFLQDQATLAKAAIKEIHSSDSFEELIKKCCTDAYTLYC